VFEHPPVAHQKIARRPVQRGHRTAGGALRRRPDDNGMTGERHVNVITPRSGRCARLTISVTSVVILAAVHRQVNRRRLRAAVK